MRTKNDLTIHRRLLFSYGLLCAYFLLAARAQQYSLDFTVVSDAVIGPFDTSGNTALLLNATAEYVTTGQCPAGFYCSGTSADGSASACPFNTYNPDVGKTTAADCHACSAYEVTDTMGSVSCHTCAAGYHLRPSPGNELRRCLRCPPGSVSPVNYSFCWQCPPGYYNDAWGEVSCKQCKPGTYSTGYGAAACTPCPAYYYTYTRGVSPSGNVFYTPTLGANNSDSCIEVPHIPDPAACLPGTYMNNLLDCITCPKGYYCPIMSTDAAEHSLLRCPTYTWSSLFGASVQADCANQIGIAPYSYSSCRLSSNYQQLLGAFNIKAVTAPKNSDKSVFFATNKALYRVLLKTNVVEQLAGSESAAAGWTVGGVGLDARFSTISAVGVDMEFSEASVVAIADSSRRTVAIYNVQKKTTFQLGAPDQNLVKDPRGIEFRRDQLTGKKYIYVSDAAQHAIMRWNIDYLPVTKVHLTYLVVAGTGAKGYKDDGIEQSMLNTPVGMAFLERDGVTNRNLLIADSGNGRIRSLDTWTNVLSTAYEPRDQVDKEMIQPVDVAVSYSSHGEKLVYVLDAGFSTPRITVLSYPEAGTTLLLLTVLDGLQGSLSSIIPGPSVIVGSNGMGVKDFVALKTDGTLTSYLESATAATKLVDGQCTYMFGEIAAADKCGNAYLDIDATTSEQCDTGGQPNTGCSVNCTRDAGWTCLNQYPVCLFPCPAFVHVEDNNSTHCQEECLQQTPIKAGHRMTDDCKEVDIDECALNLYNCSSEAKCINKVGGYNCGCLSGYYGDGYTCSPYSYQVYTVIDIPPTQLLVSAYSDPVQRDIIIEKVKAGFVSVMSAPFASGLQAGYVLSTRELVDTFFTINLISTQRLRLKVATQYSSLDFVNEALKVTQQQIATAISSQFTGDTITVTVMQPLKYQFFRALGFSEPSLVDGSGLQVNGVIFSRVCEAHGQSPSEGCWVVDMTYQGGTISYDKGVVQGQESLNVFYVPRVARDPVDYTKTTNSGEYFKTMSSVVTCDNTASNGATSTGIPAKPATACCLRDFAQQYRASDTFTTYVQGSTFGSAVPQDVCESGKYNDTYPNSNAVFGFPRPESGENDLIVGYLDGLPNSEVKLVETVDITKRLFKVKLFLAEEDLLNFAATDYNGTHSIGYDAEFFVGMATFEGTSTSIMTTTVTKVKIRVSKSDVLTLSSFGANQDPLVTFSSLTLHKVKIPSGFANPPSMYYLVPNLVVPSEFKGSTGGIAPLDGIVVGKAVGPVEPVWHQACMSLNGSTDFWHDPAYALQEKVASAQADVCFGDKWDFCSPPQTFLGGSIVFSVALPLDFITDADFADPRGVNVYIKVLLQADDKKTGKILNMISIGIRLSPNGIVEHCQSLQAANTLADIVDGSMYVGIATDDQEWAVGMQRKTNADVDNAKFGKALEFNTVTVQGSFMTFTALGADSFFGLPRAANYSLHLHDIHTIHFLEPLGGKGGPSPKFDTAKAMLLNGSGFAIKSNSVTRKAWMEPSASLIDMCPYKPRPGRFTCLSRVESTIAGGTQVTKAPSLALLRPSDTSSREEIQKMVADAMYQGVANDATKRIGGGFYDTLQRRLNLNNRYRRVAVINPVIAWSEEAITSQQGAATPYTVCTKIIATALITIQTREGTFSRRLLSFSDVDYFTPIALRETKGSLLREANFMHLNSVAIAGEGGASRGLLQALDTPAVPAANAEDVSVTSTQGSRYNDISINTDIPGNSATSSLCNGVLNVDTDSCTAFSLAEKVRGPEVKSICDSLQAGTAIAVLMTRLDRILLAAEGISNPVIVDYSIDGCPTPPADTTTAASTGGARRMLSDGDTAVLVYSDIRIRTVVVAAAPTGQVAFDFKPLLEYYRLMNMTLDIEEGFSGAGAQITYIAATQKSNNTWEIDTLLHNVNMSSWNMTKFKEDLLSNTDRSQLNLKDIMFSDNSDQRRTSAATSVLSSASSLWVVLVNTMLLVTLTQVAFL